MSRSHQISWDIWAFEDFFFFCKFSYVPSKISSGIQGFASSHKLPHNGHDSLFLVGHTTQMIGNISFSRHWNQRDLYTTENLDTRMDFFSTVLQKSDSNPSPFLPLKMIFHGVKEKWFLLSWK